MRWIHCVPNRFPLGWRLAGHAHPATHELVLVLSGSLATVIRGRTHLAGPGSIMLHPVAMEHAEAAVGGRPLSTLYLAWRAQGPHELQDAPLQLDDRAGRVESGLRWLITLCQQSSPSATGAADGVLSAILHEVCSQPQSAQERLVQGVRTFIQARLSSALSVADLARCAGLSPAHFSRTFQAATGLSPMAYLRQLRMQKARHLLLTTELPISEVGALVGYGDVLHFSKVFKSICAQPPGRLRRMQHQAP